MATFPTSGDSINAGRAISSQCQGNFCNLSKQRQDGLPVQGVVAGETRTFHNRSEWFCLVEGTLEISGTDNVLSALMKRPTYSRCADEYEICDGNCGNVRVYFPLVPCWDLCAITPLKFPGCCTPAVGEPYGSLENECDGTWEAGPCEDEEEDVACISGDDLLCQMGCSCVKAEYNKQTGRWESDYAPDRYLGLIANDTVNADDTINVTPYYIGENGVTIFYRNADCTPVVFAACRGEGIPEDFTAMPCPLPDVEEGLGCCTLPNCNQALTTQVDCTSAGGTWEAGVHCDVETLSSSSKVVVFRRRNCACCWVAEQEEFLTRTVSPTLTNQQTGMSEQNLACLFPGKLVQEFPTVQYGWCTTTDCEIEDVWLWIANDPTITEISPSDVYIGHKLWRDYNYLGDVRDVYVIEYSMGADCESLLNTFGTAFTGLDEPNPLILVGFQYDDGLEEFVCVRTNVCSAMYSLADPYDTGLLQPDGTVDDFIIGFFDEQCHMMNLCQRLQLYDTEPPIVSDNVKLFWTHDDPYEDSLCRWGFVCDIMEQAFPLEEDPGSGAEYLYIENDVCHRSRIHPGTVTCENLLPVFDLADYHDGNALVFGFIPGDPATCHSWTVCELLMSEAYVDISNTTPTAQADDWLLGFHPDPDNAGPDPLCTYGSLCNRLNQFTLEDPEPLSSAIFWTDGEECHKSGSCDFMEAVFDDGASSDFEDSEILYVKNGLCKKATINVCELISDTVGPGLINGDLVLVKTGTGICEWKPVDITLLLPCDWPGQVIGGGGVCVDVEECPEPIPSQTEMA